MEFHRAMFNNSTTSINHSSTCSDVQGRLSGQQLPGWLQGILLYNSPDGLILDNQGRRLNTGMDGSSVMSSFKIHGRFISFTKKYLKSQSSMEERQPLRAEFGGLASDMMDYYYPMCRNHKHRSGRQRITGPSSMMKYKSFSMEDLSQFEESDNSNSIFYQFGNLVLASNQTPFDRIVDPDSLETGDLVDMSHLFNMKCGRPLKDHNGDYYNLAASFVTGNKYHFIKFKKPCNDTIYRQDNFPTEIKFVATIPSRFPHHIGYFHSFGMTDNYLILCEQPMAFDVNRLKSHRYSDKSFRDCLEWMPGQRNHFYIVDKNSGRNIEINYVTDRSYFFFNFVNCYEEGDHIIVDMLTYDGPEVLDTMWLEKFKTSNSNFYGGSSNSRVVRFVLPLEHCSEGMDLNYGQWGEATAVRHNNVVNISPKMITDEPGSECPKINPFFNHRKYNYAYVVGGMQGRRQTRNSYANAITKIDVETGMRTIWRAGDEGYDHHPSEIVFVPNPSRSSEDDGIIISCVSNSQDQRQSYVVFINARNMKEISRAYFEESIPFGTHTTFIPRFW